MNEQLTERLRRQATGDIQPEHSMMLAAAQALAVADAEIETLKRHLAEFVMRGSAVTVTFETEFAGSPLI